MILNPKDYTAPAELESIDEFTPRKTDVIQWIENFVTEPKHYSEVAEHVRDKLLDENVHIHTDKIKGLIVELDEQWNPKPVEVIE